MRTPHDPQPSADQTPVQGPGPIFIGGLSKSGETELRRVLEQHPDLTMERHSHLWHTVPGRYGDLSDPENLTRCLDVIERTREADVIGFDRAAITQEFLEGPPGYERLLAIVHAHHAQRRDKQSWGVQLRDIERRAESLIREIPGAKVIHMVRDPRVRAARCAAGRLVGGVGWETAKWLESARLALDGSSRWPSQYLVVKCEDLAADPTDVATTVARFAGLDDHPALTGAVGDLDWSVLEPIDVEKRVATYVENTVGPELEAIGYQRFGSDGRAIGLIDGWLGFRLSRAVAGRRRLGMRRTA